MANLTGKPVWGVGPLLPAEYWRSAASLLQEREIQPKRESNYLDDEIIGWLDRQPHGSVMYISFDSKVGLSTEEYPELAKAQEESNRPFIWVIPARRAESQPKWKAATFHMLLIPSHPSTGGFVSHCGWNSPGEAIVRGVPILSWPIRGDQYYNTKLLANHLKIGALVCDEYPAEMVKKDDVFKGIEQVLTDRRFGGHRWVLERGLRGAFLRAQ
ncbi:hypothetical protein NL676_009769 [Syzygium grande]|nr:hypothetical protein NL676_009769 [Syzygium grande]